MSRGTFGRRLFANADASIWARAIGRFTMQAERRKHSRGRFDALKAKARRRHQASARWGRKPSSARMTSGSAGPYTRWHSTEMTRRSLMGVPIRVQAPEPRPNVTLRLRGGGKWLHLQRTMVFRGRKSRSNEMSKLVSAVSAFEASAKGAERGEGKGWRSLRMRWTMT
jgi:hypothetical protein